MTALTRGPLPGHVYWRRRLVLLVVAVALVVLLAQVLGGGSDGSDPEGGAVLSGADASDSSDASDTPSATASATASAAPSAGTSGEPRKPGRKRTTAAPVLAAPTGPCVDSDVAVTPQVTRAVAGPRHGVDIVLQLRTVTAEACTWRVSPKTVTVKITSGKDDIWFSHQCPRALPREDVVVRSAATTEVAFTWNARRSDEECSRDTDWAYPGFYHVTAAALAGEPSDLQFELEAPTAPQIVRDPKPDKDKSGKGGKNKPNKNKPGKNKPGTPAEEPLDPSAAPSGAVEPS